MFSGNTLQTKLTPLIFLYTPVYNPGSGYGIMCLIGDVVRS